MAVAQVHAGVPASRSSLSSCSRSVSTYPFICMDNFLHLVCYTLAALDRISQITCHAPQRIIGSSTVLESSETKSDDLLVDESRRDVFDSSLLCGAP